MSLPTHTTTSAAPLTPHLRSLEWKIAAVFFGSLFLTLSSYVVVPMVPVPVTMQTFAVTLVGALLGWRLGGMAVMVWLTEAAIGLPVLAGGSGGLPHFFGPTGGYLFAFPIATIAVGWLTERGWNGHRPTLAFLAALSGNALCLLLGAIWLATSIGIEKAIAAGVTPFIVGAILKSVLAAATLRLMARGSLKKAP